MKSNKRLRERYRRLTLWNKLGAWGALASLGGLLIYVLASGLNWLNEWRPEKTADRNRRQQLEHMKTLELLCSQVEAPQLVSEAGHLLAPEPLTEEERAIQQLIATEGNAALSGDREQYISLFAVDAVVTDNRSSWEGCAPILSRFVVNYQMFSFTFFEREILNLEVGGPWARADTRLTFSLIAKARPYSQSSARELRTEISPTPALKRSKFWESWTFVRDEDSVWRIKSFAYDLPEAPQRDGELHEK